MRSNVKSTSGETCYICSRKHKVMAWIALFGIFFCGVLTGVSLWGYKHAHTADSAIYEKSGIRKYVESRIKYTKRCQELEETLLRQIENDNYDKNFRIYNELVSKGCEENRQQFVELAAREKMRYNAVMDLSKINPCQEIENTLNREIHKDCEHYYDGLYKCHLSNAEVYSKLAESGCPENAGLYKSKALAELEIVDGLRGDNEFIDDDEVRTTVNTYKKLQMQNEARRYIKKAEKLINPGVDFIMELQRVIEE